MNEIMVDLETLGVEPGCVILSIGAVFFNSEKTGEVFYKIIDIEDSVKNGFFINPKTVKWWFGQSQEALAPLLVPGTPVKQVLIDFKNWVETTTSDKPIVWGNGSDFDNAILSNAYSLCEIEKPWGYFGNRCYRTIKNEFPGIQIERLGIHHDAADDALDQANHLIKIRNYIKSLNK
jgi:exodeoxyribonuclease VIII